MNREELIKDLEENIYCRLKPSSVHGVGVFAVRDIPEGVNPFRGCRGYRWCKIPLRAILNNRRIPEEVKIMTEDFYATEGEWIYLPNHGMNAIDISYFLNHSDTPNVGVLAGGTEFVTLRKIKKGEELFSDHRTYSDG